MLLCIVPLAQAYGYNKVNVIDYNGINYQITSDNTVAVYTSNYSGDIVIPATITTSVYNYGEDYNLTFVVTAINSNAFSYSNVTSIQLPNTIKSIGSYAFYSCTKLTSVTLSDGLESIGRSAFQGCTSLESITIPNSVTTMDWNAFYGCTGLKNVALSNHLRELNGTFIGCSGLESVKIPTSVLSLEGTFTNCASLKTVALPYSVNNIGANTFMGCTGLLSVYVPNSVTVIGDQAFSNNTSLTVVELPNTVTSIGANAFYGCAQLTTITSRAVTPPTMSKQNTFDSWIYENAKLTVPMIAETTYKSKNWWNLFADITGDATLDNAYDFEAGGIYYNKVGDNSVEVTYKDTNYNSYSGTVNVPSSVTYESKTYTVTGIGNYAFNNCASLTAVTLPSTISSIGSNAFAQAGLTTLALPESLTTIATKAFYGCSELSSLTIPENVSSIGKEAFAACYGLTQLIWNARQCWSNGDITTDGINSVTIGNGVEVIPVGFVKQSQISHVSIPLSVTYIGSNAFNGCESITDITIPASVTKIGSNAFSQCYGLTSITWQAKNCNSNGNMYTYGITQVTIDDGVETLPVGFVQNAQITSITIPNTVKNIGSMAFYGCSKLSDMTLPESTETIGNYAFYGCSSLSSLSIPRHVNAIGWYAFDNCYGLTTLNWDAINCTTNGDMTTYNLTEVNIGSEVKKVPIGLAEGSKITSISIPNTVDSICNSAFNDCYHLTAVTIPNSVTFIGYSAFSSCESLATLSIGANVTTIDNSAFSYCTSLTDVVIPDKVYTIPRYAFYGCSGLLSVTIGSSVGYIDYNAFSECEGLNSVTCKALTPPDAYYPFSNVTYTTATLYVPSASISSYQSAYYWKNFTNISAMSTSEMGDVNGDNRIDVADVSMIINYVLGRSVSDFNAEVADINGDGKIDVSDVSLIILMVLGK